MVMRVDQAPFDDVRVRRAMNLAVNQREIVDLFFGGNAELFAYPQHPSFEGYFEPLEAMPPSVQELFEYKPEKARRLLAEAGYPDGFTFRMQVSANNSMRMELAPLLASYLDRIGVTIEIEVMEYAAYLSMMTTRTHGPGYLMGSGHVNPTTTLRKNFVTGQTWNPSMWSDPELDRRIHEMFLTRDEVERQRIVKQITKEMLDEGPVPVAARALPLHRLVAVGEELRRRAAGRGGASRSDLRAALDRSGVEAGDGLLMAAGRPAMFDRGATMPGGMLGRSNAARLLPRAAWRPASGEGG